MRKSATVVFGTMTMTWRFSNGLRWRVSRTYSITVPLCGTGTFVSRKAWVVFIIRCLALERVFLEEVLLVNGDILGNQLPVHVNNPVEAQRNLEHVYDLVTVAVAAPSAAVTKILVAASMYLLLAAREETEKARCTASLAQCADHIEIFALEGMKLQALFGVFVI
jgi:hypothetical protein